MNPSFHSWPYHDLHRILVDFVAKPSLVFFYSSGVVGLFVTDKKFVNSLIFISCFVSWILNQLIYRLYRLYFGLYILYHFAFLETEIT